MRLICLHNVIDGPADAFDEKCSRISVAEFEAFLDAVSEEFNLVSYSDYAHLLAAGEGDERTVALSFDDGFRGVWAHARPALARRGIDAIAFINPPFLGNPPGRIFHFLELEIAFRLSRRTRLELTYASVPFDLTTEEARVTAMRRVKKLLKTRPEVEREAGHAQVLEGLGVARGELVDFAQGDPRFRIMETGEVRGLRDAGWVIGSHGLSHRTLSMLSPADMRADIEGAARAFEDLFGWRDLPFAYPYGDVVHVGQNAPRAVADAGHPVAFTTVPGKSDLALGRHLLPRTDYKRFLREAQLLGAG
ncbi:MAG: polysaccharide deacetylase family protein [Pseudomonadota bacterium]